MKAASPELIALLDSNQFVMADLYTLTSATGAVARYTDYDIDLVVGGNVFSSDGPLLSRSRVRTVRGMEVDSLDLAIAAAPEHLYMGAPILQVAHNGGLDGARLLLERAFMPAPGAQPAGTLIMFEGRVSDVEVSRNKARLTIKSDLELLNVMMPRNLYQPGCLSTLFDSACGLDRADWGVEGAAGAGSTATGIVCVLPQPDGYFDAGTVMWLSGPNAGVTRTVRKHAGGSLALSLPLKAVPQAGDLYVAYPGCDKKQATCQNKFSNLPRYRGCPYVPIPETAF